MGARVCLSVTFAPEAYGQRQRWGANGNGGAPAVEGLVAQIKRALDNRAAVAV